MGITLHKYSVTGEGYNTNGQIRHMDRVAETNIDQTTMEV
jgi:hypothetical protein